MAGDTWPSLPLAEWEQTYATLHMWSQIVGKVRLALTPRVNHWWNVPFYVTPRGLTTSAIHYGDRCFEIEFDFIRHQLAIRCDSGVNASLPLVPCPVADFLPQIHDNNEGMGIEAPIWRSCRSGKPDPL